MTSPVGHRVLEVVDIGWSTTIQDRGRPGLAHLGVPTAGAVDLALAALVNRLVGNDESSAVLETAGGLVVRVRPGPRRERPPSPAPRALMAGEELAVAVDEEHTWSYLAIRGGIAVGKVLGSRGGRHVVGNRPGADHEGDAIAGRRGSGDPSRGRRRSTAAETRPLQGVAGPCVDWFDDGSTLLTATEWRIETVSRVGLRLSGTVVRRVVTDELASEGLVPAA